LNVVVEKHHLDNLIGGIGPEWRSTGPVLDVGSRPGIEENPNGFGEFVSRGDMERGLAFDILGMYPGTVLDQVLGGGGATVHRRSMEGCLVEKVS